MNPALAFALLGALLGAAASALLWLCARAERLEPWRAPTMSEERAAEAERLCRALLARFGIAGDADACDEVTQDVLLRLVERGASERCALSTQVFRLTQTVIRARRRSSERREQPPRGERPERARRFLRGASRSDVVELIDESGLTDKQRAVARMLLDGSSMREISRALGVTRSTVRGHVQRARAKMALRDPPQ